MQGFMFFLSIGLGLLRPVFIFKEFNKHITQSYQAFAHICVGWLFAVWWFSDLIQWHNFNPNGHEGKLLVSLTVVEVVCAVLTVVKKKHDSKSKD